MRLYSVYECDHCGKTEESDGFPKGWFGVEIRTERYYHDSDEESQVPELALEKDCCSEGCVRQVLEEYLK